MLLGFFLIIFNFEGNEMLGLTIENTFITKNILFSILSSCKD